MLDFNPRPAMTERVNALVDAALEAERAAIPPRDYLGGSRLGHHCERALQFEFTATPRDEGAEFSGRTLRIFAIGHALEDLAQPAAGRCPCAHDGLVGRVVVGEHDRARGVGQARADSALDRRSGIARRDQDGQLARRSGHCATRANDEVSVCR